MDRFAGYIPPDERSNLLDAYRRRLEHPDPAVHMPAARAMEFIYEGACSTLLPSPEALKHFGDDIVALGLARIEAHYFANGIFLPPGQPPRPGGPHPPSAVCDRSGTLRHGVSRGERV